MNVNPDSINKIRKPVKVLHLITRMIVGGAQENTMFTTQLLHKEEYIVDLYCGPQTGSEGSLIEEARERKLNLKILPYLVREVRPVKDIITLFQLILLITKEKFTIVHTHSSKAGILGRLAAIITHTPIVIHTVHGWSFHDNLFSLIKHAYIFLERIMAQKTDALVVVCERDKQKGLSNRIGNFQQYHLIRSSIPLDEFIAADCNQEIARKQFGIPSTASVLGNIGRFSQQKNPIQWIRIASIVAQEIPGSYFFMAGNGPLSKQVTSLIRSEGLEKRFILPGLRRDVATMLATMDVFLLTSLWEGLPRVIAQAFMMNIPVVAFSVDGVQEAITHGDTGYLCPTGDINSAAKFCIELLTSPRLRMTMGNRARIFAQQNFDLNDMVAQIENLYQCLLLPSGK
jgi:glycosyltransferase involved in cell wall biosynthesis